MTGALDRLRNTADRLTSKYGKTVEIGRETESFDPATGTTTTSTTWTEVVATPPRDFTLDRIEDTLIQQGDTVIRVAAKGLDLGDPDGPTKNDKVRFDGSTWGIVQVGPVYSGEQIAMYTLHLRR